MPHLLDAREQLVWVGLRAARLTLMDMAVAVVVALVYGGVVGVVCVVCIVRAALVCLVQVHDAVV